MTGIINPRSLFLALPLLAALIAAPGCAEPPQPARSVSAAAPAPTVAPVRQAVEASEPAPRLVTTHSGSVRPVNQLGITPKASGRIVKLYVDAGSRVKLGDPLFELDRATQETQLVQAQAGLAAARARLASVEAGPRPETIAQAEAGVEAARQRVALVERGGRPAQIAQAEAGLRAAQARLAEVRKGVPAAEVQQAKLALDQAKNALWAAQIQRDGLCGNGQVPQFQCKAGDAQVAAMQTAVEQAESRYLALQTGPTAEQVAQAESAVQAAAAQVSLASSPNLPEEVGQAKAALRVAEAQLELARKPATRYDLDLARAEVDQAQAAVDLARIELTETTVRAPFAGLVARRDVAEGSLVGPTAPTLTLVSDAVEVAVDVDEATLLGLDVGRAATVATNIGASAGYQANVSYISPTVDAQTRTGLVRLNVANPDGRLRAGMFAQVVFSAEGGAR